MIKNGMSKVYDRVNWFFLLNVLIGFAFSRKFCNMVVEMCANSLVLDHDE